MWRDVAIDGHVSFAISSHDDPESGSMGVEYETRPDAADLLKISLYTPQGNVAIFVDYELFTTAMERFLAAARGRQFQPAVSGRP